MTRREKRKQIEIQQPVVNSHAERNTHVRIFFYHAIRMLLFLPSLLARARVCIKMYEALECGKVSEFGSHTLIFCGLICTPAVARKQH